MVGSGLRAPHIRFYVSDHGYGHAARSIAIIRALHSRLECKFSIRTLRATDFMRQSLPYCRVDGLLNDVGPVMNANNSSVDISATIANLNTWYSSWDSYIKEEVAYCHKNNVDLILSDITPQAFCVSSTLGIPGIGISNFTWDDIYSKFLGLSEIAQKMHNAYSCADAALVLPFHGSMGVFKELHHTPLISRERTCSKSAMRRNMGIPINKPLIYVGSGLSINLLPKCLDALVEVGVSILLSGNFQVTGNGIYHIPQTDMETQNYIGMCDLVVTKSAYSTVSEAVSARVPLLLYHREGIVEDSYICDPIVNNKIGSAITWNKLNNGDWIDDISSLLSLERNYLDCNDTFMKDGVEDCMEYIGGFL